MEPIGDRRIFQPLPGAGYGLTFVDAGVRFEVRHLRRAPLTIVNRSETADDQAGDVGAAVEMPLDRRLWSADLRFVSESVRLGSSDRAGGEFRHSHRF